MMACARDASDLLHTGHVYDGDAALRSASLATHRYFPSG